MGTAGMSCLEQDTRGEVHGRLHSTAVNGRNPPALRDDKACLQAAGLLAPAP